jgi:regulator of sigma E protease
MKYLIAQPFFVLAGLIGIGFIIGFHEFGHFVFCKLFKIRTPNFSIGFGPKIFEKKIGDTNFSISVLPFGGYLEIAGNAEIGQGEQKLATSTDEDSFVTKPLYQKILVMLGGILFNLLFGYLVYMGLFFTGAPGSQLLPPVKTTTKISQIAKDSPAEQANLKIGDIILSINKTGVKNNLEKLLEELRPLANKKIKLSILRDSKEQTVEVKVGERDFIGEKIGIIGVGFSFLAHQRYSLLESFKLSGKAVYATLYSNYLAIKYMIFKKTIKHVGGTALLIYQIIDGASKGIKFFLLFLAFVSIGLAVINLIPLPITDGGQILFVIIEAIIRRPIPLKIKEYIHLISWIFILMLFFLLTVKDVKTIYGLMNGK